MWRWDQAEPFGDSPANEDPDGNSIAFDLPLRLPGQYYDGESGLHYNYHRDFSPAIGRYVQADPLGVTTAWPPRPSGRINNLYAYVAGGPLFAIDPFGLVKWTGWGRTINWWVYGRTEYDLVSECKCGLQVHIRVTVNSVGSKGRVAYKDEAEFEDDFKCPEPMGFAGPALGYSAVIAVRYGVSYSRTQIGRAVSSGWSAVEGLGAGIGPWFGGSDVEILSVKSCCKK